MARNQRYSVFFPAWVSIFVVILAVPALGQGDSGINICGIHNSTYTNNAYIYNNVGTTSTETCQCNVYSSGTFQTVISFEFPKTDEQCGEGITIIIKGQDHPIKRCSRTNGPYPEHDQTYIPNGHLKITYTLSGKGGWMTANITASGKSIRVICNPSKAKDPQDQPSTGVPWDPTTSQPPAEPGKEPTPTTATGPENEPPSPPSAGPENEPSQPPGTGPGNEPNPSPSARPGKEPNPAPGTEPGNEPHPPPAAGPENQSPPPPAAGPENQPPPPSDHLRRTIMIAVIAITAVVSGAGLIGIAVVCFRRRKRAPIVTDGLNQHAVHYTAKNKRSY